MRYANVLYPLGLAFILLILLTMNFCHLSTLGKTLIAYPTDQAPVLDGLDTDEGWKNIPSISIPLSKLVYEPNNGYEGFKETTVKMKAIYTQSDIFFYTTWDDPTASLMRFPWEKQKDGSWKQLKNVDQTNHENTFYEDKMAIFWDIHTGKKFMRQGCQASCHLKVDTKSIGRKYTDSEGETLDTWHWKSVRTDPVGIMDDQWVDHTQNGDANKDWGRKSDDSTGGGYTDNIDPATKLPKWQDATHKKVTENQYWILDSNKEPFVDTYQPGDRIAGIIISPATGSRGDIHVASRHEGKKWILEFQRSLITRSDHSIQQDVQFVDLTKPYFFGISIFDNSQINHLYHEGTHKLMFESKQ